MVLAILELLHNIIQFVPRRLLCNLGLVSRAFRSTVLTLDFSLQFDESKILPGERKRFLRENGPRIYRAELSADISIDRVKPEFHGLLSDVKQHCATAKDIVLHLGNALDKT